MSKKFKKKQPVWVWSVTFEWRSELEVKNIFSPLIYCKRENPKVHRPASYKRNQICSDLHKNCWEHFSIWYCAKIFLFTMMVKRGQCHRNCCAEHTKPPGISHRIAGSTQTMANSESAISSSLVPWILQLPLTRSIWRPEIAFTSSTDLCQQRKQLLELWLLVIPWFLTRNAGMEAVQGKALQRCPRGYWGIGKLFCSHFLTKNHSRPNPVQVLCSMDGQATQTQTDSNLPAHFPHKLLLKKVLRSTLRKIRQNLKMNAMLEIAYITNLFLIGTINKNTY